jgi:hypothetical protein
MLRNAGHRLVSIKWSTSTSINLSTRQLQMNFSATWERSPWYLLQRNELPTYTVHQPTWKPNELQCYRYLRNVYIFWNADCRLASMKWANQLVKQTTTNELQCYLWKVSMLWSSGRKLTSMKWATFIYINQLGNKMNFTATWERFYTVCFGTQIADWLLWNEPTNLPTRQLQMNFRVTWERPLCKVRSSGRKLASI